MFTAELSSHENSRFFVELVMSTRDFHLEWKRCNLVANYLAEYTAYQFERRERAENLISTVLNELLESSARISTIDGELNLKFSHRDTGLLFDLTHDVPQETAGAYEGFLKSLKNENIDEYYLQLLTTEDSSTANFNQLGLVVLVHDFNASLSATIEGKHMRIQVGIPIQELSA